MRGLGGHYMKWGPGAGGRFAARGLGTGGWGLKGRFAAWVCAFGVAALLAQAPISERAREVHAGALVFDGHIHAVDRVFYHGGDIGERKADGQFDLSRAKEGGLGAFFFSVFVTEDYYPGRLETKQALRMLEVAIEQIEKNRATVEIARNASDVERI